MIVPWVAVEVGGIATATVTATGGMAGFTAGELTTLIAALTSSVLAIIAAVVVLIKSTKTDQKVDGVQKDVQEVHVLVDGHLTRLDERVTQLTAVLETSDKDVPAPKPGPDMASRVAQLTVALEGSDTPVPDPPPTAG